MLNVFHGQAVPVGAMCRWPRTFVKVLILKMYGIFKNVKSP